MGRQAPGANNVVDGLIRFGERRGNVELVGFIEGVTGLVKGDYVSMTRESFKNYVNLGGIDYIGRGPDELRTNQQKQSALEMCKKLNLQGLVLVGATHTLSDGV
jgi:6-phosphofructokinase 1